MTRGLPDVALTDCSPDYARLAVQGWDTVQEAFALTPSPAFCDLLDAAKRAALEAADDGDGVAALELNGMAFLSHATGAK